MPDDLVALLKEGLAAADATITESTDFLGISDLDMPLTSAQIWRRIKQTKKL